MREGTPNNPRLRRESSVEMWLSRSRRLGSRSADQRRGEMSYEGCVIGWCNPGGTSYAELHVVQVEDQGEGNW